MVQQLDLLARQAWGRTRLVFGCVSRGCANAQDREKKKKKVKKTTKKKQKVDSLVQIPTKTPTSTGLACVVCVCGFGEGGQGGAWGRRLQGWHRVGVRWDLAMAWVFWLLGIRAHSEEHGLSGVEGRGWSTQSQGKKRKKKKDIRTRTKTQFAHRVVYVVDAWAGGLQGWLKASSMW